MRNYEKFIGETKGIFTLLEIKDHNKGMFKCLVCNKEHEGNMNAWIYGGRKRCGMGKTGHKLYDRYDKMIQRCHNEKHPKYPYYGARGIKVCDRWRESFHNFLEDMESSFEKGLQLDRIDNDGNYEPDNCRWVTHSENMLNRRDFSNNPFGLHGVRKTLYNSYVGRFQKNKVSYSTKSYKTPEKAYEALQQLKSTL